MLSMSKEELLEVLEESKAASTQTSGPTAVASSTQPQGDRDSWKELYRVLVTSLRHSSAQFQALSFESLTLGLWGLSTAHATQRDDIVGRPLGLSDRSVIKDFIYYGEWARAFETGSSITQLAAAMYIQACDVVCHQPLSQPMAPAHLLAVDHANQQLLLVVRGTSQLADALTDLVAHTTPLGIGQAHSGMLDCAHSIIRMCMPALEQQLQANPGYRIHCIGHSLGGGVAALVAYLLRNTQQLRSKVSAASGVMATGFGTPPVMTQQLAESVSSYVRTLVHNYDLVPRTCVASLAVLHQELEAAKEAAFANNATMAWLRDSGALQGGKALVAGLVTATAANTSASRVAAAVTRSPAMQRFMTAGLQAGAALLANKMKQMHVEAMAQPGTATGSAAITSTTISTADIDVENVNVNSTVGCSNSSSSATASSGGFAALLAQAVHVGSTDDVQPGSTASTAAAAAAGRTAPTSSLWGGLAALKQASASAATKLQQQQQQQVQPAQGIQDECRSTALDRCGGAGQKELSAVSTVCDDLSQQELTDEAQAANVMLYSPGQLYYLKRTGEDADAKYELLCQESCLSAGVEGSASGRFSRIVVNRSMLRDHYLTHYITGLHKLEVQLLEAV